MRMGGGDKGLLVIAGGTLARRAVLRLRGLAGVVGVIVNANRNRGEYEKLGCVVVADASGGDGNGGCAFAGPLAGILAGMRGAGTEWVLTVPCDSPFFPQTLARDLMAGAKKHSADIAVAFAGGRAQPVFMLARRSLAEDLSRFLKEGGRKIDLWYPRHSFVEVPFANADDFANINTPEDLAAAEKRL